MVLMLMSGRACPCVPDTAWDAFATIINTPCSHESCKQTPLVRRYIFSETHHTKCCASAEFSPWGFQNLVINVVQGIHLVLYPLEAFVPNVSQQEHRHVLAMGSLLDEITLVEHML